MRHIIITGLLSFVVTGQAIVGLVQASQDPPATESQSSALVRVDLNAADQPALESLPGIGPRTAELIIEYRNETGGFKKVEELMNIRGIGERTFLRLRELVRVGDVQLQK